ncbi:unnamed protein product [Protopolystoma xenopodis]|uniref:Uncharacterized protein n=1 Tax=Protopolystoma xenopodis TaxID=117903 RepID=A0A448WGW9_9PLAT|nr:unnamed protein product [Protopolystoma xenopodis]
MLFGVEACKQHRDIIAASIQRPSRRDIPGASGGEVQGVSHSTKSLAPIGVCLESRVSGAVGGDANVGADAIDTSQDNVGLPPPTHPTAGLKNTTVTSGPASQAAPIVAMGRPASLSPTLKIGPDLAKEVTTSGGTRARQSGGRSRTAIWQTTGMQQPPPPSPPPDHGASSSVRSPGPSSCMSSLAPGRMLPQSPPDASSMLLGSPAADGLCSSSTLPFQASTGSPPPLPISSVASGSGPPTLWMQYQRPSGLIAKFPPPGQQAHVTFTMLHQPRPTLNLGSNKKVNVMAAISCMRVFNVVRHWITKFPGVFVSSAARQTSVQLGRVKETNPLTSVFQ